MRRAQADKQANANKKLLSCKIKVSIPAFRDMSRGDEYGER